jgi:glycosyltransferase involved in cell wall biosynthesis
VARLRVLAVTSEPPWPLDSGGRLRTFHLLRALSAQADVRLLCPVQPDQTSAVTALDGAGGFQLRPVFVGPRTVRGEAWRLAQAAFRGEPYALYGRHAWPAVFDAWRQERAHGKADVLYLDHLDSFMYVSRVDQASQPTVLDLHNVYSRLALRAGERAAPWTRGWLRYEAHALGRVERRAAQCCDLLFAVSDLEAGHFRNLHARLVKTVPNGVDAAGLATLPIGRSGPPVVLFLGTLSWRPNVSAVQFLAREAFPRVRNRIPDAKLLIVGRDPAPEISELQGPGIDIVGPVPEVRPYLAQASVLAVPLDAGGGTRLKILEAFAAGLPVVSTRVGAEGLMARAGTHFVEAERPGFANALADLLSSPEKGRGLAEAGRRLAQDQYDWKRVGNEAATAIVELGSRGKRGPHSVVHPADADHPVRPSEILDGRHGRPV